MRFSIDFKTELTVRCEVSDKSLRADQSRPLVCLGVLA